MTNTGQEFQLPASKLSLVNVFSFSSEGPLDTFIEMWYQVFLWALFSSLLVHFVAATIAFSSLRRHKYGRFLPGVVILMGFLGPLTGGIATSAAIAGVYRAASFRMAPFYPLIWGVGQTFLAAVLSFTRILATL